MGNKKIYYWLLQFLGWAFYLLIVGANAYAQKKLDTNLIRILIILYFVAIATSHLMRLLIIKLGWLNSNLIRVIPQILILSLGGAIIVYFSQFIAGYLFYSNILDLIQKPLLDHFSSMLGWWIMLIIWSAIYWAFHLFNKSKKEEIKNLQLQASQNEIMLNQLRSQLNPHFIFNALNSIKALISENPNSAKNAVNQLSVILRSSLQYSKHKTIPLTSEIETVKAYLELEKIRFEERLKFKINVTEEALNVQVPPLMLQTIVENAVKHGVSKSTKGGEILIQCSKNNDKVVILVQNTGHLESDDAESGIGIANTKKRLEILFGNNYEWQLREKSGCVEAIISFPSKIENTKE